ncbi:MAG: DUF4265 domain-containing protein [Pseudomonadota bacterium]
MPPSRVKFSIRLTEEQIRSFPVSIESMWFEESNGFYLLKNVPQFVDDLSYDDLVSLEEVGENLYVIEKIVRPSKNSTIWILLTDFDAKSQVIDSITALGCGIEGGALKGYYTVNVPERVDIDTCYAFIDMSEELGLLVADYPSIRH